MSDYVHPLWGRPLNEYLVNYDLSAAQKRADVTPSMEAEAGKAISIICKLAGAAKQVGPKEASEATIQMLQSILNLALSPRTFHHFALPPLISGCVKLMGTVKVDDKPSPFSFEYGYMCFKIITIGIGINILQRTGDLAMTIANMESDTETELILILSGHVSRVLEHEIKMTNAGPTCDWVLGWVRVSGRPQLQQEFMMLRVDILLILNTLWEDREAFLKVFMATCSPGLSGVIFILWRYMYSKRMFSDSPPPDLIAPPFCEVLWRYLLVATADQLEPLTYISNDIQLSGKADVWRKAPKRTDLNDLRTILQIYTDRLSLANSRWHTPLELGVILILLSFVSDIMQPEAETFIPQVIGLTLDRMWDILNDADQEIISQIGVLLMFFGQVQLIRPLNHTYYANRVTVLGLIDTLVERNIPDMIARVMILLEPYSDVSSPVYDKSIQFLEHATELLLQLESIAPQQLLRHKFHYYVFDWIKIDQHFVILERSLSVGVSPQAGHFQACRRVWYQTSKSIGIERKITELLALGWGCFYSRCSNPAALNIGYFSCELCCERGYCSIPCQARGWEFHHGNKPHRGLCARSVRPFTPEDFIQAKKTIKEKLGARR